MSFSVNTNAGAFRALQNLNATGDILDRTQTRINTGYKVSSARDNAAIFSIAQNLRADVAGYNAVKSSLDRAISEVDIALAGAEAISDILIELREKTVAAKDDGLDAASRTSLNDEFTALKKQITSIVENAEFNGRNLLTGNSVTAVTDANGSSTISTTVSQLTLSALSLDTADLVTIAGSSVTGTVVSLAGQSIAASTDSEFRAALVNAQTDNGGNFGGETIDGTTGVTTNNVGGSPTVEFETGLLAYFGTNSASQLTSGRVDGYAYDVTFAAGSTIYLVRNGASSSLSNGDPEAGVGDATSPAAASATLTDLDAAIDTVNTVLSNLGSTANRLALQQTFTGKLADSIDIGIGNLVDADLAKESALLQATQTKQQLGLQALGIANQGPQTVLSLFR